MKDKAFTDIITEDIQDMHNIDGMNINNIFRGL